MVGTLQSGFMELGAVMGILSSLSNILNLTSITAFATGSANAIYQAMATLLKGKYKLVDLKISLDDSTSGDPMIRCELEAGRGDVPTTVKTWVAPVSALGMPREFDRTATHYGGYSFRLPEGFASELRSELDKLSFEGTLWLHLARPYGYLGLVPWEALLSREVRVPIVRLPNFLVPPPLESPATLDVLICASSPVAKAGIDIKALLRAMIPKIIESVPRKVKIHLFTDLETFGTFQPQEFGTEVILYPPGGPVGRAVPGPEVADDERLNNPWLLWMHDALRGRSIDIAHFICHGYMSIDRGALAFAESPTENQDRTTARFVGTAELTTFLTQIGAWGAAFSSPPQNFSEMGLRLFADIVALLRPLSILHHRFEADPGCGAMGQVYKLFTSSQPEMAPVSEAVFVYCQPYHVKDQPGKEGVRLSKTQQTVTITATTSGAVPQDLVKLVRNSENVPDWIAASQRYIEQCQWQMRKTAPEGAQGQGINSRVYQEAAQRALGDIQKVVAKLAAGVNG